MPGSREWMRCGRCAGRGWLLGTVARSTGQKGYGRKVKCERCDGKGGRARALPARPETAET